MRIIIELTEAESPSTMIQQQAAGLQPGTQQGAQPGAQPGDVAMTAIDAGPPAEGLVLALGGGRESERSFEVVTSVPSTPARDGHAQRPGGDAGEPASWLVDAISTAAPHSRFH